MAAVRAFLRQHLLWGGLLAVVVPLFMILCMQYWSLSSLERTSAVAVLVTLRNYLNAVSTEVKYYYQTNAERVLNISPQTFTPDDQTETLDKIARHFEQREIEGVTQLFVMLFTSNMKEEPRVLFYNAERSVLEAQPNSPQTRAVRVASAPWYMLYLEGSPLKQVSLAVHEQDPRNRIILNPILDTEWKVVGVAGMILDEAFFQKEYLPKLLRESLARHLPERERENMIVSVYDEGEQRIFASQLAQGQDNEVRGMFWFVFTDWQIGIQTRYQTPEQWAQWNFWINVSLSVLMTLVLIGGIILVLRSATRAVRLSQMKTDFVSNVSHELRTPLASVRVFGEFLRLGRVTDPEKIREYGQYIETESRRLTQLINNILDFSKIESGQKTYHFETLDIQDIVAETVQLFKVRLEHSGLRLAFDAPSHPLPAARIDPDALVQALVNLLDNAVKYSGEAKDIRVRLGQRDGFLSIAVTDYGLGVPRDQQDKVFEKFYRVPTGLVHEVKGSGLGLSIVKHVVEAHGGQVTVESQAGQGSTFTIFLPTQEVDSPDLSAPQQPPSLAEDADPLSSAAKA